MTWGELVAAVEAYGVKPDDRIMGIRIDGLTADVGIKRTPMGIQIVSRGRVRGWPGLEPSPVERDPGKPAVRHDHD